MIGAGDIRRRLCQSSSAKQGIKQVLKRDPEDPSAAALKEPLRDKVSTKPCFGTDRRGVLKKPSGR